MRVATIGECMVEFRRRAAGSYTRAWGGDTLNVAVYLARLGTAVDYVTLLGDDPLSSEMVAGWAAEGVGTRLVAHVPGRLPGLYLIETDASGERTFLYWRSAAPVRDLIRLRGDRLAGERASPGLIYLSGVTLSLFEPGDRARLLELLAACRAGGARVAFDDNFRPRGWPDRAEARAAFTAAFRTADIVLPSFEDEAALYGDAAPDATVTRLQGLGVAEIVVKYGAQPCLVVAGGEVVPVAPADPSAPVDTTAAGDSFNAAYLAARLGGSAPAAAARAGHRLAAAVISHRGAIIPRAAMPEATLGGGAAP